MSEFEDILDGIEDLTDVEKPINHVAFIKDHSGSMGGSERFAIKQFNEQLKTLREESKDQTTFLTSTEFSDFIKFREDNTPLERVNEIDDYPLYGSTSLYDAIGMTINKVNSNMKKHPSKNQSALVIIITDGGENSSEEWRDGSKLKKRIEELEGRGNWTFTFLGADFDCLSQSRNLGMNQMSGMTVNTMHFNKNARSYDMANKILSTGIKNFYKARGMGAMSVTNLYEKEEDEDEKNDTDLTPRARTTDTE